MLNIFKFFHLICGTTFLGIIIAEFFYIAHSMSKMDQLLLTYSLKASYFGDGIIFFLAIIQLITANELVSAGHFTLTIPWIFIAYHAFAIVILLWLSVLFIKVFYLAKSTISPIASTMFYLLNVIMISLFIIIIHDAVTQSTWFEFLFRNE